MRHVVLILLLSFTITALGSTGEDILSINKGEFSIDYAEIQDGRYFIDTKLGITSNETINGLLSDYSIIIEIEENGNETYHRIPLNEKTSIIKGLDNVGDDLWILVRSHVYQRDTITNGYFMIKYELSTGIVVYNQTLPLKNPDTGEKYSYVFPNIIGDKLFIFGSDFRIFKLGDSLTEVEPSELYGRSFSSSENLGGVHAIDFDGDTFWAYHKGIDTQSSYGRSTDHKGKFIKATVNGEGPESHIEVDIYEEGYRDEFGEIADMEVSNNTLNILWEGGYVSSIDLTLAESTTVSEALYPFIYTLILLPIGLIIKKIRNSNIRYSNN